MLCPCVRSNAVKLTDLPVQKQIFGIDYKCMDFYADSDENMEEIRITTFEGENEKIGAFFKWNESHDGKC